MSVPEPPPSRRRNQRPPRLMRACPVPEQGMTMAAGTRGTR
jgi:hypothetical protein